MDLKKEFEQADMLISQSKRVNAQIKIADKHSIAFYNWMQDNYFQVSDGFVKDRNIDESKRTIITIEKAMDIYKKEINKI